MTLKGTILFLLLQTKTMCLVNWSFPQSEAWGLKPSLRVSRSSNSLHMLPLQVRLVRQDNMAGVNSIIHSFIHTLTHSLTHASSQQKCSVCPMPAALWEVLGRKTCQCLPSRNHGLGDNVSAVAGQSYYSLQIYGGEMSMYGHRSYCKNIWIKAWSTKFSFSIKATTKAALEKGHLTYPFW